MKQVLMMLVAGFLASIPFSADAADINQALLERTIAGAKSFMSPSDDASASYDPETKHLYISFTTPPDYKTSQADYYERWRHNQWVFLQEFRLSKIPVKSVTIETNLVDSEGSLRYTHKAVHVDKYADLHSDGLWLRTGKAFKKKPGSDKWEALD